MVKQDLSLTEIIMKGEYYLPGELNDKTRQKILDLVKKFKLDSVYDALKSTEEWEKWSRLDGEVKFFYEEIKVLRPTVPDKLPRVFLRDWSESCGRCPVVKIEVDVPKY